MGLSPMSDDNFVKKSISGTREWAVAEINCSLGCPHGCRYCYARYDQVERKGLITAEKWCDCSVLGNELTRKQPLYPGQVMFPSAHDIVPENLEACLSVLRNLVAAGNKVLVVSKPHFACIHRLCSEFLDVREQLLFRFTITARKSRILKIWEPHAPEYAERKKSLEYAFRQGYATSVSVEPMLDTSDVAAMVEDLLPFINHSIWLGKMNKIKQRVVSTSEKMQQEIDRIEKGQCDKRIFKLYYELAGIPQVRWKESIKRLIGLQLASEPGLDL
jgi:DNA repair photolyase